MKAQFKNIKNICETELQNLEMWPSYFSRRYFEFLSFYELLPKKHFQNTLEIGCSVGYYAAFLSKISEQVVATDQPDSKIGIHQGNLKRAKTLLKFLGITNVSVQAVKGESLPFPDNSFDLVFSSHVFGYIKDQKKAVSEIRRVLRPGGIHFCVVPARASTAIRLVEYYFYISNRIVFHLTKSLRKKQTSKSTQSVPSSSKKSRKNIFLPQTQGAQETWIKELRDTSHTYWNQLMSSDAELKPILQISSQMSPLLPLLSIYFPHTAAKVYGLTRRLELKLGSVKGFKTLGLNSVLIQEKSGSAN